MSTHSLADKLVIMAILALPYDAIPHILPFVYRPLSLYFIVAAFAIYLLQNHGRFSLPKPVIQILFFSVVSVSVGSVVLLYHTGSFVGLKYYVPGLAMGMLSVIVFSQFLSRHKDPDFPKTVLKYVGYAYIPAMFLGTLETLSCYHILPHVVKSVINAIFGGWQEFRPCLTNSEASYASQHMVFAIFVYAYLYKVFHLKKWMYCTIVAAMLLLFTVSTKGYLLIILSVAFYGVFSSIAKGNFQKMVLKSIAVLLVLTLICFAMYQVLLLDPGTYFAKRVLEFKSISETIESDSSAFVRLGLPMIALKMFLHNPLLGLGAGGCHVFTLEYIQRFMPFAMNLNDVLYMRKTGNAMSSAIIFQVLANFGVYGFVLFIRPLVVIWKRNKKIVASIRSFALLFSFFIVQVVQSGNWAYMHMWFLFAFFSIKRSESYSSFAGPSKNG